MNDLRLPHVRPPDELWQQREDFRPGNRCGNEQVEDAVVIARVGRNVKHAANKRPVGNVGQRDRPIPDRFFSRDAHVGRRDAVHHAAKNGQQVDQVADGHSISARDSSDLRIEADARAIGKKAVVELADIHSAARIVGSNAICQQ